MLCLQGYSIVYMVYGGVWYRLCLQSVGLSVIIGTIEQRQPWALGLGLARAQS